MGYFRTVVVAMLACFGALQLAGCAATDGSRATGQVFDDGALTARVKAALAKEASLNTAKDVNVTTYRGVVQLSGFVESEDVARRAVAIAGDVDGVRSVDNALRVNPARR